MMKFKKIKNRLVLNRKVIVILYATRHISRPLSVIRMEHKEDIIEYISIYCTDFYNELEKKAIRHYVAQVKFLPYKDRVEKMTIAYNRDSSNDPEVLKLLKNGIQEFHRNAAERVLNEHFCELTLNTCPKCGGIARTPTARQCRYCNHNWR